jgi:hypothetical protein
MTNSVLQLVSDKWVQVAAAVLAYAAPLVFNAAGITEPAFLQTFLNLIGTGALAHAAATFVPASK